MTRRARRVLMVLMGLSEGISFVSSHSSSPERASFFLFFFALTGNKKQGRIVVSPFVREVGVDLS
jgi:hypothetical protein